MTKFLRSLLASALFLTVAAAPAFAQSTSDYFVGALSKAAGAAAIGAAPAVTTVAVSGATQTVAFGTYGSSAYDITLSANCTFTFTAPTTLVAQRQSMFLNIRNTAGTFTMTWPGALKWSNGTVPTFVTTAGTVYLVEVVTTDGGVTYTAKLL